MNNDSATYIDIPLSFTKVARIIEENSELRVNSVERLGEGLEFQSFLVSKAWVFRFPKHVSEYLDPSAERVFSQNLKLSVSVPEIRFIWNQPWGYPEMISGYEYLPGTALEHCPSKELDQEFLAIRLGAVLTEIHAMNGVGVPSQSDQLVSLRTWSEDLDAQLNCIADNVLSPTQRRAIKFYIDQYKFDLPSAESTLIHGDLGADHILLDEQKQLSGIIDWSNHSKGNRYRDFVGIWRWGGDAFCARVLYHYPTEPSLEELAYVRVMGLVSCISRVILLVEQQSNQFWVRARTLLEERLSEITNRCPYETLGD